MDNAKNAIFFLKSVVLHNLNLVQLCLSLKQVKINKYHLFCALSLAATHFYLNLAVFYQIFFFIAIGLLLNT